MAKTHLSLSHDPALRNAPTGFTVTVRDLRPYTGAGWIVALCGDMMTMPGLGKTPAAFAIDIDEYGRDGRAVLATPGLSRGSDGRPRSGRFRVFARSESACQRFRSALMHDEHVAVRHALHAARTPSARACRSTWLGSRVPTTIRPALVRLGDLDDRRRDVADRLDELGLDSQLASRSSARWSSAPAPCSAPRRRRPG